MNPPFDIASLLPPASWQAEKTHLIKDTTRPEKDRRSAEADICTCFDPYVRHIARSYWKRYRCIHGAAGLADVESAGRYGLIVALQRWQPGFGKPFVHFASRWIAESSKAEAAKLGQGSCRIPRNVRKLCADFQRLREIDPAAGERLVAGCRTRRSTKLLVRYLSQSDRRADMSLDSPGFGEREDAPLITRLPATQMVLTEEVQQSEAFDDIRRILMTQCSARDRLVFYLRFPNLPLRWDEVGAVTTKTELPVDVESLSVMRIGGRLHRIAAVLGLTRERVRQIDHATMEKLKLHLRRA